MLGVVFSTSKKSSTKIKNNRKRTKVFDPCISNKKKKFSDENSSDENRSLEINLQYETIKKRLLTSSKKDLNKTMDDLCVEFGLSKYVSEDDLSDHEMGCAEPARKSNSPIKCCLDKVFEGLDEYAGFRARDVSTPNETRNVYSSYDSDLKATPGWTLSATPKSVLGKNASLKDSVTGRNSILQSNRDAPYIDLNKSWTSEMNVSQNSLRTPFLDRTNTVKTPEPLSGFSRLAIRTSPRDPSRDSAHDSGLNQDIFTTPVSSRRPSISPLSPDVVELPPEIKRTILVGVVCYVDVKTNKEDCSSSVALELLSMGATVEKTLNKKVTHVVFKEGKRSTYLKAQKTEVTMVSVLWLEACKKELKLVDPSLYPPVNLDKYQAISPNGVKIPTLRTIQRKLRKHLLRDAGLSGEKSKVRIKWRNAVTDIKARQSSSQESSQGRLCTKKLEFQKTEEAGCSEGTGPDDDSIIMISDSPDEKKDEECAQDSWGSLFNGSQGTRRQSAPARMVSERKKRKRKDDPPPQADTQTRYLTIDKMFAKQTETQGKCVGNTQREESSQGPPKKRKLFDPSTAIIIIDSPDQATPPPYQYPYQDDQLLKTTNSRARKTKQETQGKSSSMRKIFKKLVVSKKPGGAARKSLNSLLEQEEASTSRNSLSYFAEPKSPGEPRLPKEPPTIVCTSLLPEGVRQVAYMTGKLGVFDLEEKVSSRTTHLVTSAPRRTINLLNAMVRGAWILHVDWVLKSEKAGYWLNEEDFELKTFSHAVTELRRERQAFGAEFCCDLFSSCGSLYVSRHSVPPHPELKDLVKLSKGRLVHRPSAANLLIGGKGVAGEKVTRVKEKWVLDSITQNTLLDTDRYIIRPP